MKLKLISLGLMLAISASATSQAATDYERIRKDVKVMANIVNGAFENDKNCRGCNVSIETQYLAEQGAVFTINQRTAFYSYSYSYDDDDHFPHPVEPVDPVQVIDVGTLVGQIMSDVGVALEDVSEELQFVSGDLTFDEDTHIVIDRQDRSDIRSVDRARRQLEYEIREKEIEMIHADEKERAALEKERNQLEQDIAKLEEKREVLSKAYEAQREKQIAQIKEKREQAREKLNKQLELTQDIVLQAFCDYGSTLQGLPRGEKVSVIFENKKSEQDQILVFDKDEITECRSSGTELREEAISYNF